MSLPATIPSGIPPRIHEDAIAKIDNDSKLINPQADANTTASTAHLQPLPDADIQKTALIPNEEGIGITGTGISLIDHGEIHIGISSLGETQTCLILGQLSVQKTTIPVILADIGR